MSQSIKLKKLQEAPAKRYQLEGGITLEKTENEEIIISSSQNAYKTVKIYESSNPNIEGTIELQNNPEYSCRINIRKNSDIAVDPSKNNSAILFKAPKKDFVGSYVVRPSQANYIRNNIKAWKENLSVVIPLSSLDQYEEQAREYMQENNLTSCEFDVKVGEKTHKLSFKVTKSADLTTTVNDINSKRINRTEPLSDKQVALIDKYNNLVEAEKAGKIIGLSIALGDRELRHSYWNPKSELGSVEHTELQKSLKSNTVKQSETSEEKAEDFGDLNDIIG